MKWILPNHSEDNVEYLIRSENSRPCAHSLITHDLVIVILFIVRIPQYLVPPYIASHQVEYSGEELHGVFEYEYNKHSYDDIEYLSRSENSRPCAHSLITAEQRAELTKETGLQHFSLICTRIDPLTTREFGFFSYFMASGCECGLNSWCRFYTLEVEGLSKVIIKLLRAA